MLFFCDTPINHTTKHELSHLYSCLRRVIKKGVAWLRCSSGIVKMFEISDVSRRSDVEFDVVATHQSTVRCE